MENEISKLNILSWNVSNEFFRIYQISFNKYFIVTLDFVSILVRSKVLNMISWFCRNEDYVLIRDYQTSSSKVVYSTMKEIVRKIRTKKCTWIFVGVMRMVNQGKLFLAGMKREKKEFLVISVLSIEKYPWLRIVTHTKGVLNV